MHVATDHSTAPRVSGPVSPDGTFEFIPIVDGDPNVVGLKYAEVATRFPQHGASLDQLIPAKYEDRIPHFDPDLVHGTYADPLGSRRAMQLARLEEGDYLFFVASLAPFDPEVYKVRNVSWMQSHQRGRMRKMLIGYFWVAGVYAISKEGNGGLTVLEQSPSSVNAFSDEMRERVMKNAHSQRTEDEFLVAVAATRPVFLQRAVALTEAGSPFDPLEPARRLYGMVNYPRGFKWLEAEEQVKVALELCQEEE